MSEHDERHCVGTPIVRADINDDRRSVSMAQEIVRSRRKPARPQLLGTRPYSRLKPARSIAT